jgi:hypothetical protein
MESEAGMGKLAGNGMYVKRADQANSIRVDRSDLAT